MSIVTPSIPASGTPQANTTGQTVDVSLTGGTVSNVSVFNPETGASSTVASSTPATYSIPPGGTHTITWSVVPTGMTWTAPLDLDSTEPGAENTGNINETTDEPEPAHSEGGESGLGIAVDN